MAELETKSRPLIFQFRSLVIVNIEGRRAGLMFNLKWGKKGQGRIEVWVETKVHLVGNSSLKSITILNYEIKLQ